MNIYRVVEDGVDFLIRAKTMTDACSICLKSYIDEVDCGLGFDKDYETERYETLILESCELLGELKN